MSKPAQNFITCRCQICSNGIEFDANQLTPENRMIVCPHCGGETLLTVSDEPSVVSRAERENAVAIEREETNAASKKTKSQFLKERIQGQHLAQINTKAVGDCSVTITMASDEPEFDSSKLQGIATPKQVAYLSFMGVHNATSLTKREAAEMINSNSFLPEVDTMAAILRQQSHQSSWTFQRLVLHPELYSSELADFLEKNLPDELHAYIRGQIVGSSERLTKSKIREVIDVLLKENPAWWHSSYRKAIFHDRLKLMYPGCCDGRSTT